MSEPVQQGASASERWRKKKRIYGLVAVVAFVAGGFFLFGPRVPKEVHLRFDLPPMVRDDFVAIDRTRVGLVSATITDPAGTRVAAISLPSPGGLDGPRTAPVVVNLKPGRYAVRARVKSIDGREAMLEGVLEVEAGEVVVALE